MGLFSCFLLRDSQGVVADGKVQVLAPARLRGPWYTYMFKVTWTSKQLRGWGPIVEKPSRSLKAYPDLSIFSYKYFVSLASCCDSNNSTQLYCCSSSCLYAAVEQQQQRAYECCSNRVLLEWRWVLLLLLLLSARVCARDCLDTPCSGLSRSRCAWAIEWSWSRVFSIKLGNTPASSNSYII